MTKSIVSGGVMLVALVVLVMGLTNVMALSNAGIVSWAAVGAVATILFGAFGGFKPFFPSGMPFDGSGGDNGEDDGSPLEVLRGQSQSITRKLVTVGAEDEKDRPLFDDRAPVVGQPNIASPPSFDPDSPAGVVPGQPNHPLFGQALREQLDSDRSRSDSDADHDLKDRSQDAVAFEGGRIDTGPADSVPSPPLIGDAAPWVAARNAQINEDAGSVPTIEVEESPSWMSTADIEELDADARIDDYDPGDETVEADAADPSVDDHEADGDAELLAEEDDSEDHDVESEDSSLEANDAEADGMWTEADLDPSEITDDVESQLEDIESIQDDDTIEESSDVELLTTDDESQSDSGEADATLEPDLEDSVDETSTETAAVDISESAGDELVEITTQSDQLPVVMKPPSALEIQKYSPSEILAVVRAQESELVDTLIGEGVLTTSGPITDKDVRTMLFVAVSSNELIDVLTEASGDSPQLGTSARASLPKG